MMATEKDVLRRREGYVRCICPMSPKQEIILADHLQGISVSFGRQGLTEFAEDRLIVERHRGVLATRNAPALDAVIVEHPVDSRR